MKEGDMVYCYNDYTEYDPYNSITFWYGYYYKIHKITEYNIIVAKNERFAVEFENNEFGKYFLTDKQLRLNKLKKLRYKTNEFN